VIAAINWVVDHQHDNGMNIRVLNLSYGTNSTQPSLVDPLSFAAERAWRAGIVGSPLRATPAISAARALRGWPTRV
jgi:hypothetical protein